MKLTNINTVLTYVSLLLVFAIILSIIFGCYFRKHKIERFAEEEGSKLSTFESDIIKGLSDGSMDHTDIEKFIENGSFTKDSLNNMIKYVENIKDKKKN